MIPVVFTCFCIALVALSHGSPSGGRIIGGKPATAGEFPFISALHVQTSKARLFCTASMIDRNWLITAAQCVEDAIQIKIHLGIISLTDASATIATTEDYHIHPQYNNATLDNDVALIKTRAPLSYSDYIGPVSLPARDIMPGSLLRTAGWGQIDDQLPAPVDQLHQVEVVTLSDLDCKRIFGSWIVGHMVCVGGSYNEGTCRGDSGAPLLQYVNGITATIVGVSTFISKNGCMSTDPSGFTKIHPYLDWIRSTTLIPSI